MALVGYTNAGKSTLFNSLTGNEVYVKNQLFATLDTTVRKFKINKSHKVLISDTVGFIGKLPHNLIASFRSTLKEAIEANLILIVLDASSSTIDDHLNTIKKVLNDLGAEEMPKTIILNKIDQVQDESKIIQLKNDYSDAILVSALHHLKLDDIKNHIIQKIESDFVIFDLNIPYSQGKTISQLKDQAEILDEVYGEEEILLKVKGKKETLDKIIG